MSADVGKAKKGLPTYYVWETNPGEEQWGSGKPVPVWFPYATAVVTVYAWKYLSQCCAIFFAQRPAILRDTYSGRYLLYSSLELQF